MDTHKQVINTHKQVINTQYGLTFEAISLALYYCIPAWSLNKHPHHPPMHAETGVCDYRETFFYQKTEH